MLFETIVKIKAEPAFAGNIEREEGEAARAPNPSP